jgi:acetyltransferase-like isoleucine patch superfamily enzyme
VIRARVLRVLAELEYWVVRLACIVSGPAAAIRYLRNPSPQVTVRLLRSLGAGIGDHTVFKRAVFFDNVVDDRDSAADFRHLQIGRNCFVGDAVFFDLANRVVLEDDVVISAQVAFLTHADCNPSPYLDRHFPRRCEEVRVQRGAWIGMRATVLSGVVVGSECVIGAHALVRKDTAPRTVYAGVPALPVRRLQSD